MRELLKRLISPPPPPTVPVARPPAEPLESSTLPAGGLLIDARLPSPDLVDGARPLPAEILFGHLSELPPALGVVAEDPQRARRIVRRLRQCGRRAWVWTGPAPLVAAPHRGRRGDGWWVYSKSGETLLTMRQEEGGLWEEGSVELREGFVPA